MAPAPIGALVTAEALSALRDKIVWMPDPGSWRYLADPFAIARGQIIHVYVEAFDYRTKHAVIEHHALGPDRCWGDSSVALAQPFHLSYPFLVEEDGEVFMIPESHKAQEIALYRAADFPHGWKRETALLSALPGAEPSLLQHNGRWWMFFTVVGRGARDQRELHVAFAERLTGPWSLHPLNPVLDDRAGARPGGTPFVAEDGCIVLPVQDCSETYGGALRFLRFSSLNTREAVCAHLPSRLTGDLISPTCQAGLHTLSSCGDQSFLDVKRIDRSHGRRLIDAGRRLRRLV